MVDLLRRHYTEEGGSRFAGGGGVGLVGFSFGLLLLALASWGGLWLWSSRARSSLAEIESKKAVIQQELKLPEIQAARLNAQRITRLTERMQAHVTATKFLGLVEGLTHPRMQFAFLSANSRTGEVTLRGQAASLGVLAESLNTWLNAAEVESASIPEMARREAGVSFRAEFKFHATAFVR